MAKRRRHDSLRASWLAMNSSNGIGLFLVHNPPGERKVVMPHSVEIPAPVNGTITPAACTKSCRRDLAVSRSGAIILPDLATLSYIDITVSRTGGGPIMRYLHTMLRVRNLDAALDFYCNKLGLTEVRRRVDDKNKFTLVFLAASADGDLVAKGPGTRQAPLVELTYNWDSEDYGEARYFGHLAYEVDDVYALCDRLMKAGVTINRPPRDGMMAFVRSPDKHSIELLQKGEALPPKEPWTSMPNTGKW